MPWPALGATGAGGPEGRGRGRGVGAGVLPRCSASENKTSIFLVKSLKPEIRTGARSHGSSLDSPPGKLFLLPGTQGHSHFFPVIQPK